MYIIEFFIKWLNKNQRGNKVNPEGIFKETYQQEDDEAINCKHNFMPIDSSGSVLACTKCGLVIKSKI